MDTMIYGTHTVTRRTKSYNMYRLNPVSTTNLVRFTLSLTLLVLLSGDVHPNPGPTTSPDCESDFKIASLNTRSIKRVDYIKDKLADFKTMCHIIQPDIFVITESWLKDFIDDTQIIDETYQVHRQDRIGKGGGGILILVKSEYFSEERPELLSSSELANEIFAVEVKNDTGQKLLIIGAYRPDSVSLYNFVPNLDLTLCNAYQAGFTNIIVTGDFNTRNITWTEDSNLHLAPQDMQFTTLLEQYGLTQMVREPTTLTGYIDDLFITSFPDQVHKLIIRGYDYDSDHFLIEALIQWNKNKQVQTKRTVYDMTKADFIELKLQLTNMDHTDLTSRDLTIDQKWEC